MAEDYKIKWHGKVVFDKATEANARALKKATLIVEGYAKKSMKTGTGRTINGVWVAGASYASRGGKRHKAAKAGKPPAVDLGNLRSSIQSKVTVGSVTVKGEVGSDENYALFLEIGTRKMKARPYLRPAIVANRRKINRIFKESNS